MKTRNTLTLLVTIVAGFLALAATDASTEPDDRD